MKILVFTETYLPTQNGVVSSIELFRHELESRGHQVFIVTPESASEHYRSRRHVFRLPALPFVGQPTHPVAWPSVHSVTAIIDEVQPDIIHAQGMFMTGYLCQKAAKKLGLPMVLTYHTHLDGYAHYAGPLSLLARPFLKLWTRKITKSFDVIITPSPSVAKLLKSYGVKNDIVALPTGIPIKDYDATHKDEIKKELGLDPSLLYILYVGRLAEEKNVTQLLIDFGRASIRVPQARLILAGDGPKRKEYEKIIENRRLTSAVTFLGAVPHSKLISYFIAADIFAFPSLTDTQGIVLIEAMASGLPCVVYDMLGPGDIIKQNECGLKAKPGTDQFFENLFNLIQDQSLRDQLSLGAQREARKYSIEKTTDQLEQIYQVLVNEKK